MTKNAVLNEALMSTISKNNPGFFELISNNQMDRHWELMINDQLCAEAGLTIDTDNSVEFFVRDVSGDEPFYIVWGNLSESGSEAQESNGEKTFIEKALRIFMHQISMMTEKKD